MIKYWAQIEWQEEDRVAWRSYLGRALSQSLASARQQHSSGGGGGEEVEGGRERLFDQALNHCKHDVRRLIQQDLVHNTSHHYLIGIGVAVAPNPTASLDRLLYTF